MNTKKTLTKQNVAKLIKEELKLTQNEAVKVVNATLSTITDALLKGQRVEIRGFGSFNFRVTKPRVGRNPNNPTVDVQIPARTTIKFKPSKEWKAKIAQQ